MSFTNQLIMGWREWLTLPSLGIEAIKAKIDTGARTSALHAFKVQRFFEGGAPWLKMHIHPLQHDTDTVVIACAPIIDERKVTDSGGHSEKRVVISAPIAVGDQSWPIEITVTDRDSMLFRMLLGRTALRGRVLVDPARSFILGRQNPTASRSTEVLEH